MVEGIVYALVAHGTILLAEYSNSSGNFTQVGFIIAIIQYNNNTK